MSREASCGAVRGFDSGYTASLHRADRWVASSTRVERTHQVGPFSGIVYLDILLVLMKKVLLSIDDKLLRQIDRAAQVLGLSRSAYLSRLAARELGTASRGRNAKVRRALARLDRLGAENGTPVDPTAFIRRERDAR